MTRSLSRSARAIQTFLLNDSRRPESGYTMKEIANALDIHYQTVWNCLRGDIPGVFALPFKADDGATVYNATLEELQAATLPSVIPEPNNVVTPNSSMSLEDAIKKVLAETQSTKTITKFEDGPFTYKEINDRIGRDVKDDIQASVNRGPMTEARFSPIWDTMLELGENGKYEMILQMMVSAATIYVKNGYVKK